MDNSYRNDDDAIYYSGDLDAEAEAAPLVDAPAADAEVSDTYQEGEIGYEGIYRATGSDPLFGLLIAGAVSIGMLPLISAAAADMRYTLTWGLLALFGVTSWLIGSGPRVGEERPENLAWGIAFGLLLGVPLLIFGSATLSEITDLLFAGMTVGTLLAYLIFVMPLAETLFFRGILQESQPFWVNGLMATGWQLVLFFPLMNREAYPLIMGMILLMGNLMLSYVRDRNGLAAAWLCQIVVNFLLLFIPFAS